MAINWTAFANKFAIFENRTITLTSVRNTGNVSKTQLPASRGSLTTETIPPALAAAYVRPEAMYCVRLSKLGTSTYKPGDLLVDSSQPDATESDNRGITYTIQWVEADDAFVVLYGFNPKIAFSLEHTIDIYLNEVGRDAAASTIVENQAPIYTDLSARVQPVSGSPSNLQGKFGTLEEYSVYLYPQGQTIRLTHNHIIVWTNPETNKATVLDVKSWRNAQQIDRLMEVQAEVRP